MRGGPGGNARVFCYPGTMSLLTHPAVRRDAHGRVVELWLDPAVQDVVDRLRNGDPSCGWEGDERLALYMEQVPGRREPSWVLERLEDDGVYRVVTRSRPGADLRKLPQVLVEHDRQRGFDAYLAVEAHNAALHARKDAEAGDRMAARLDRVVWSINRDTHGGATDGAILPKVARTARRLAA